MSFFDDAKIQAFPIQWYTKHMVYTTITPQYLCFYATLLPEARFSLIKVHKKSCPNLLLQTEIRQPVELS